MASSTRPPAHPSPRSGASPTLPAAPAPPAAHRVWRPRAVFFDIDDTLYDFEASYHVPLEMIRTEWAEHFGHLEAAAFRDLYWRAYASIPEAEKDWLIRHDRPRYQQLLWSRVLALAGAPEGIDPAPLGRRLHEVRFASFQPHEGVIDLLAALRGRARLGVVTNGPSELQRWKLAGLKVHGFFDPSLIFVSGEVGYEKPDRRIFEGAAKAAGVDPSDCLFVGDRLDADLGCKAVGMTFALFHPGARRIPPGLPYEPDYLVRSYAELASILM